MSDALYTAFNLVALAAFAFWCGARWGRYL